MSTILESRKHDLEEHLLQFYEDCLSYEGGGHKLLKNAPKEKKEKKKNKQKSVREYELEKPKKLGEFKSHQTGRATMIGCFTLILALATIGMQFKMYFSDHQFTAALLSILSCIAGWMSIYYLGYRPRSVQVKYEPDEEGSGKDGKVYFSYKLCCCRKYEKSCKMSEIKEIKIEMIKQSKGGSNIGSQIVIQRKKAAPIRINYDIKDFDRDLKKKYKSVTELSEFLTEDDIDVDKLDKELGIVICNCLCIEYQGNACICCPGSKMKAFLYLLLGAGWITTWFLIGTD